MGMVSISVMCRVSVMCKFALGYLAEVARLHDHLLRFHVSGFDARNA